MIRKYSRYPSTMRFSTYYNNNQNEAGIYTASIKNGEEMRYTVAQLLERGDVIMGEYTRIMGALKVINMGGAK